MEINVRLFVACVKYIFTITLRKSADTMINARCRILWDANIRCIEFNAKTCTIQPARESIDCPKRADTRKPAPSKVPGAGDLEQLDQWRYRVYDGEEWIEYDERNDTADELNVTMPITPGRDPCWPNTNGTYLDCTSGKKPSFGVEEIPATKHVHEIIESGQMMCMAYPDGSTHNCSPVHHPVTDYSCPKSGTWFLEQATNGKSYCRKLNLP